MTAVADMSLEQQVALLPPDEQDAIIGDADPEALLWDWGWNGRQSQILPIHEGETGWEFQTALALAGRGWGKTLCGAQWIRALDTAWATLGRDAAHMRVALVGRTAADVRDVMLEGPSGILNIYPPSARDQLIWTPSRRRLELPNGGVCLTYSAEEPSQLRGPQFHIGWCVAEGTKVRTAGGELPIEAIETGDQVWTRDGLRPVLAAGMTGIKQVITLRAADGRELSASGDHKVWTQRGWTYMRDVVLSDIVYAWPNQFQARQPSSSGMASSGTETQRTATTETAAEEPSCISPSGSAHMAGYPRGTRSTMSTTTAATTTLATSHRGQWLTTGPITLKIESRTTPPGLLNFNRQRPAPDPKLSGKTASRSPSSAETAASASRPSACEPSTAHRPVLQPLAVVSVEKNSGWTRTYDLTVGGTSEYFAEGLLVHNSDELAAYKQVRSIDDDATAWENLRIAVRLGTHPQILATTTPKRVPLLRQLLAESVEHPKKFLIRRGKTTDNKYLSEGYLDVLESLYGGTALGRQELEGEMLDDVAGAMTSESIINRNRIPALPDGIPWIKLLSIDPSVAERPQDECGMVVIYISKTWPVLRRHAFIIEDLSVRAAPAVWGEMAIRKANEHNATIVVETNQGANLVFQMLRQSADALGMAMPPMKEVWATKAKAVRSEPVGGAYARGRIHHVGELFPELESQITSWVAGESGYSPDRQDALVQGCASGLFPEAITSGGMGTTVLRTVADQHIPLGRGERRSPFALPTTRSGFRGY